MRVLLSSVVRSIAMLVGTGCMGGHSIGMTAIYGHTEWMRVGRQMHHQAIARGDGVAEHQQQQKQQFQLA